MATTTHPSQLFPLSPAQRKVLTGRLNEKRVSNRSQGGRQLSYLEAWDVRTALIRVFGFGGWSGEVTDSEVVEISRDIPKKDRDGNVIGTVNFRVTAKVTYALTIHQTGAVYTEVAAATQSGADLGEVMDFALKTAASDAFKRGAMNLGTQFGLSLYDNGSTKDVVRMSFAPGQEWPVVVQVNEDAKQPNAEGQDLVNRAIAMAKERDDARATEVTTGPEAPAPEGSDQPMALDPSYDNADA